MNIFLKVSFAIVSLVLFVGLPVFTTFFTLKELKSHVSTLNIAGRQRMLTQKMGKDMLYLLNGDDSFREDFDQAVRLFEDSLNVLINGGSLKRDNKEIFIPSHENEELLSQLKIVDSIWKEYRENINTALYYKQEQAERNKAHVSLKNLNRELLYEMDKAVMICESLSVKETEILAKLQIMCFLLVTVSSLALIFYLRKKVFLPIKKLQNITELISEGDLSLRAPIVQGSIVGSLSSSFNSMAESLNGFYVDLEKKVAERTEALTLQQKLLEEKNRLIEADLSAAKQVQESLLPREIPPIPFMRITTRYQPIDNIGGDYFDVVKLGGKYGFLIADVVGHGVKAAFLTTLLRIAFNLAAASRDTADTLRSMSSFLIRNISSESFVTAFYAIYDPSTGKLSYSSAGHPSPVFFKAKDASCHSLKTAAGMPLGFVEFPDYKIMETTLDFGDKLILYTDGIEEAIDSEGKIFGQKGVLEYLDKFISRSEGSEIADILTAGGSGMLNSIFEVRDDITLLIMEKVAKEDLSRKYLTREMNINQVCEEIYAHILESGFADETALLRIILCVDEALNNAVIHGNLEYPSQEERNEEWEMGKVERLRNHEFGERKIGLSISLDRDNLTISVADDGPGFNPKSLPDPTDEENLLKTGGRGLRIIRQFMDSVEFNEKGNEISMSISKANIDKMGAMALPYESSSSDKKVLIIDDNPVNIALLKKVLTAEGYNVAEATDPFYGLLLVGEFHPDLVILDLQMPEVSGADISKRLKSNAATKDIKILVVSAHLPSTLDELHAIRADDYLSKPVGINALIERVAFLTGV